MGNFREKPRHFEIASFVMGLKFQFQIEFAMIKKYQCHAMNVTPLLTEVFQFRSPLDPLFCPGCPLLERVQDKSKLICSVLEFGSYICS